MIIDNWWIIISLSRCFRWLYKFVCFYHVYIIWYHIFDGYEWWGFCHFIVENDLWGWLWICRVVLISFCRSELKSRSSIISSCGQHRSCVHREQVIMQGQDGISAIVTDNVGHGYSILGVHVRREWGTHIQTTYWIYHELFPT